MALVALGARMDLSYDDDIDTRCVGCDGSAHGWGFAVDGRRLYICPECAPETEKDHPQIERCRGCAGIFLHEDNLNAKLRCAECVAGQLQME